MLINQTIIEMNGKPFTHPTSVNAALGDFFYGLTRTLRPNLIVEIGCFIGYSTLHFAQALRDNAQGRIIAIDLFEPHPDLNVNNPLEIATYYRQSSGLQDLITYKKGHSSAIATEMNLELKNEIDLLFIDGDHSVKGTFSDFNNYYPYLKTGGYLLLHDINPEKCGTYGARVLVDYLKRKFFVSRYLEFIELRTIDGYGMALFRKIHRGNIRANPGLSITTIKWGLKKLKRRPSLVEITIRDSASLRPVSNALFICSDPDIKIRSDSNGKIIFKKVAPGTYSVDVLAEGYKPTKDYAFKISSNRTYRINIDLSSEAQPEISVDDG